jgi:hypothetical protein
MHDNESSVAARLIRPPARVRAAGALLVVALGVTGAVGQPNPDEDPLPLLRIELTPEQLVQELARVKQGTLVKLPRADFEARVRKAAAAAGTTSQTARLVRAHYVAELSDHNLVQGRGEWAVVNPGSGPSSLSLSPLSLALSNSAWEDGTKAVVGDFDGKGLRAWVPSSAPLSLFFDWACRGTVTAQGVSFDLRLPSSPQTTLELKLPADCWPAIPTKSGLLTGPHDAGAAGKRLWKLQLAGKTQVELVVRKVPAVPVSLFVQTQSRQLITPDRIVADYEFLVEVPRGAVRELVFDGDASLEPIEVTARTADLAWRWDAPARTARDKPGSLTVEFRAPQHGSITGLRVRCFAPRPVAPTRWNCPALRLRQAVGRSETLKLTIHPDVQLERWSPGDFQLLAATTETDGGLTLTLGDTRATLATASSRPHADFVTGGAEYVTVQKSHWHIAPGGTTLTSDIAYRVSRGALHQLALKVPAFADPFHVDGVDFEPKAALRGWTVMGPWLLVDLQQGITPRNDTRLRVQLRSTGRPAVGPQLLDLPDLVPQNPSTAGMRDVQLHVTLDPQVHAQLLQASVPPRDAAGTGRDAPAFAFAYHDQPLAGKLRLFLQRPAIQCRSTQDITLGPDAGEWKARVEVEPLVGRPTALDVYLSAAAQNWRVKATGQPVQIHHVERLLLQEALAHFLYLGAPSPLHQATTQLGLPAGERWRLHLAAPLAQKATLEFAGTIHPSSRSPAGTDWDIPVLCFADAEGQEVMLSVRAGNQRIEQALTQDIAGRAAVADGGVRFQLDPMARALPRLAVRTAPEATTLDHNAICESSELTTRLQADGTLVHFLRVRLRNWHQPQFAVTIAGSARALAARIDGAWLDRLDAQDQLAGTCFRVPVNANAALQQIELLYFTPATVGDWGLCRVVHAPQPELQKPPLMQRWYWRLPSGWEPWQTDRWQRRGTPDGIRMNHSLAALPRRAWHVGPALSPAWDPSSRAWMDTQRADLLRAEGPLRAQIARDSTLGAALDAFARQLGGATPVIVDTAALRAAAKYPATVIPPGAGDRPFWDALDLVFLPCPSGPLLTTPRQIRRWQDQVGAGTPLGEVLDSDVAEAVLYGRDHGGTLFSAAHWLRTPCPDDVPALGNETTSAVFADPSDGEWTEWEPVPGLQADPSPVLLNMPACRWLGYAVSGIWLMIAAWLGWRLSAANTLRTHLVVTALLVLVVVWLPASVREGVVLPVLVVEIVVFTSTLTIQAWPRRSSARPSKSTMVPSTAAVLLCVAVVGMPLAAQPGIEPQPVYLVAGAAPGQQAALVSPDVLRKLDELANRPGAVPAGGVVVAASYLGQVKDGVADIAASFDLHHFAEQSTFVLPLTGVQLQPGVFMDGVPIFPVAHKGGYALPLRGKGWHQLTLRFQARAAVVTDHHELRFGVPRAGQCRLELNTALPTGTLQLVGGFGDVKVQPDKKGSQTLSAQLGHEGIVHLRWPTVLAAAATSVEVREAYFWDLRPATVGLTAGVQFTVAKGSLAQVRFALPEGLEIRQVEVAPRSSASTVSPAPALGDWEVVGKDAARQLVIGFTQPITGTVTLGIEMVPRLALTPGQWLLRLPAPLVGTSTGGLLAYRLDGMDAVSSPQNLSVGTVITPELLGEYWVKLALREPATATNVMNFRRVAPSAALGLTVQPARPRAQVDAHWRVGSRHADVTALASLTSSAEDVMLVELELPPRFKLVQVADAGGTPVHHWSRQDRLVQVWLSQPRKQVRLAVDGWVENAKPGAATPFELAALRVLNVRSIASAVVLEPEPGQTLVPQRLVQLAGGPKRDMLRFTSDAPNYEGSFSLRPADSAGIGTAFTLAERRSDGIEMTTALYLHPRPGPLQIKVSRWEGDELRLETPAPVVRKSQDHQGTDRIWTLDLPPGLPQRITVTLRGRLPVPPSANTCTLPAVHVTPYALKEHWIALVGVEPTAKEGVIWSPPSLSPLERPTPPRDPRPGARIGRLANLETGLALHVPAAAAADTTHILGAEQRTVWDGAGWLHQLHVLALAHGRGEVRIRLPEGAHGRAVTVDDQATVPDRSQLAIPLPGPAGPRWLRVYWTYDDAEASRAPRLDWPVVEGIGNADFEQRISLPAAYHLAQPPGGLAENAVNAILRRAEMRMHLCQLWADFRPPDAELRRVQQAFHRDIEEARARIEFLQHTGRVANTASLLSRARALTEENERLAEQGHFQTKTPAPWASAPPRPGLLMPGNGLPLVWPWTGTLPLALAAEQEELIAAATTELLLLGLIVLLLISFIGRGAVLMRTLWPETLLAIALLGFWLDGLTLVGVALLLLAGVLRGLWVIALVQRVLPGWFASPTEPPNSEPSSDPAPGIN